jgi:hypothetical protein
MCKVTRRLKRTSREERKWRHTVVKARFGTAVNIFLKFKEALPMAAHIQFGDVAKLIELNMYYVTLIPKESDYLIQGKPNISEKIFWPAQNGSRQIIE